MIMPSPLDLPMTQAEFGAMVGISQPAVSELIERGTLTQSAHASVWLREYISALREVAAGRMASGDLSLATERARLAKEQADRIALQNAITRREYAPTVIIEEVLTRTAARINVIFEALTGSLRRNFPDLSAEKIDHINREIAKARNLVSEIRLIQVLDEDAETVADVEFIEP